MMPKEPIFFRYRLHHLLFWLLLFGTWFFFRSGDYARTSTALLVTAIKVADLALMIYITNELLVPRFLYRKRYGLFALLLTGMVLASSIGKMYILGYITDNPALYNWSSDLKRRIYDNVIPHFFLVIAGAAIKLMYDYGKLQQRMAETAKEKAEAELSFLKSQINPHFVFNALNAIYFLISRENPRARQALHRFSDMLRYQLYEMNAGKVPVEKELSYLRDYIALQQLRLDEKYSVEWVNGPELKGFSIEPLLLVPLVENAFKHVSHYADSPNFIKVETGLTDGFFYCTVHNSRERHPARTGEGGIGLQNVRRRLELLYPGTHELQVQEGETDYRVSLKIKIV